MRRLKVLKIFIIFIIFVIFLVISNLNQIATYFLATITFNSAILTVFTIGVIVVMQSVIRLTMLAGTFGVLSYKKGKELEFYLDGISKIMPATIANMFEQRSINNVLFFTDEEAKSVTEWLENDFFNLKGYVGFFVGTALMIGLFGTFTGLLVAIDQMGVIILGLGGEINLGEVIAGFAGPLSGMAIGFGSSLFGVAAAIILNFLQYILSRQQAAFIEDVEDWLKGKLIENQSSSTLKDINQKNGNLEEASIGKSKNSNNGEIQMGTSAIIDIISESLGELSLKIEESNKSSSLVFKNIVSNLEKNSKSIEDQTKLLNGMNESLKELNVNQFSMTSSLETALEEVSRHIASGNKTNKLILNEVENFNINLKKKED